nr:hypothetical protein [Flagellatimonas centrodinii]
MRRRRIRAAACGRGTRSGFRLVGRYGDAAGADELAHADDLGERGNKANAVAIGVEPGGGVGVIGIGGA